MRLDAARHIGRKRTLGARHDTLKAPEVLVHVLGGGEHTCSYRVSVFKGSCAPMGPGMTLSKRRKYLSVFLAVAST